ncbi:mitochondrial ribosomal protein L9 [Brevipalpus obovatus]|uniref:mitochondrial ribosomal protein L9 n=1 Tax=Brevipalpus obovatus TaxID=246614 RepID=UPI003D9F6335
MDSVVRGVFCRVLLRPSSSLCGGGGNTLGKQTRSAWKFKRFNPVLLGESRESKYVVGPYILDPNWKQPLLENRIKYDDVYIDIHNTDNDPKPPMKVLLLQNVPLLGIKGEIVEVECERARYELIPSRKATYASPRNLDIFKDLIEQSRYSPDRPSSKLSQHTLMSLEKQFVLVLMNHSKPWTIQPSHIRIAFRMAGIQVPEYAIHLPEKPITGPNPEYHGRDFIVRITVNKNPRESTNVRCVLHLNDRPVHKYWDRLQPRKAVLPEQQETLDSMFMHEAYYEEEEKVLFG